MLEECGRPLGMRFHDGKLYVLGTFHIRCCNCVDAYFGLHAIEKNGTVKHLVSEFEGHRFKYLKTRRNLILGSAMTSILARMELCTFLMLVISFIEEKMHMM